MKLLVSLGNLCLISLRYQHSAVSQECIRALVDQYPQAFTGICDKLENILIFTNTASSTQTTVCQWKRSRKRVNPLLKYNNALNLHGGEPYDYGSDYVAVTSQGMQPVFISISLCPHAAS
jgi:hypothetical protein